MSVVTNNILKLLSDLSASADKIVEENESEFMLPRISEWISIVKNKALRIRESETPTEFGEIPSLASFLKGTSQQRHRVSTVLTEIQKLHVHRKAKERVSMKDRIKTPLRRKSNVKDNETFLVPSGNNTPKLKMPPINKARIVLNENVSDSTSSVERQEETSLAVFTPVNGKGATSKMARSSLSKRKSSSELSLEIVKKPKVNEDNLSDTRERDKSMQNGAKLMKAKNANIKSISTNVSVLNENRTLRSRMEAKQEKAVEIRKNILALRQQKLQQNKRTREEKLEKTIQQRLKLEKEKLSKLRSGGLEKTLTNTNSNKEATPKPMYKTNAENETLGETSNPVKNKEKQKLQLNLKKAGSSILKSNEKIPPQLCVKNTKHGIEKVMDTTYIATDEPSTSSKGKTLKEVNIATNSVNTKDVSNDNRTQIHAYTKKGTKTVKPLIEQKKLPINSVKSSTPVQKKVPESYAMTPARSSFVSYDISEIRSDSEDEEQESNSKPIPKWATGVRLRNALLQQHHHPTDSDELFGNFFDPPDLAAIMGIKKKHYNKRTSSAVWNYSFA